MAVSRPICEAALRDQIDCRLCGAAATEPHCEVDARRYRRCTVCALVFLEAAQLPDAACERAVYEQHRNDPGDPRYRAFLARLTEPLRRKLRPGMEGLDYGAGPGPAIAAILGDHGLHVTNYDPFFHPDRVALTQSYDFVTCSETAEHFHHPGAEFARLDRLIRPGGWLGVMTCRPDADTDLTTWWYRRDPTHVAFYADATMAWIAGHFGWVLELPSATVALFQKSRYESRGVTADELKAAVRSRRQGV